MLDINVEPTAEAIDAAAKTAFALSKRLEQIAKLMRDKNDISHASEAVQEIATSMTNFRLDLLVARPVREYQIKIRDLTK
ncbi:MAG: hypothetical protein Q7K26_00625 [bacterium]|nr:hypothetical protein [bacterium]